MRRGVGELLYIGLFYMLNPQSRQNTKISLQSSEFGLPDPLTRRRVCPPPPPLVSGGKHIRRGGKGGGGDPNSNEGTDTGTLVT
jgi:hypothetical protein